MSTTNTKPTDATKQAEAQKDAEGHFFALQCARLILLSMPPRDALCIAVYASETLAELVAPEGQELPPLIAIVRDANLKMLESIEAVPEEQLECSDDHAWAEGMTDAMAKAAPRAPGSLMVTVEVLLHYLGGSIAADNPLAISTLEVPPEVQRLAHHLLTAYRKVMKAKLPRGA